MHLMPVEPEAVSKTCKTTMAPRTSQFAQSSSTALTQIREERTTNGVGHSIHGTHGGGDFPVYPDDKVGGAHQRQK